MSTQGIGVEIHPRGVRVTRVRSGAKGTQVQLAAEASFPEGTPMTSLKADSLPEELAAVLQPRFLGRCDTSVVMDHPSVFLSTFRLAAGFTDDLKSSIKWYAEQYVPYPVDQAAVDYRVQASPYGGQKTVCLIALQKAVLHKVIELLPPKRVKLRRIDGIPYSLYRLYRLLASEQTEEPAVVVHANDASAYVLVVKDGGIRALRHVRLGTGIVVSLADKVRRTCQYYEVHHPAESICAAYVTLPTVAIDGMMEGLAEELGVKVHVLDPTSSVTFATGKGEPAATENWAGTYSLALGAAL